MVEMLWPTPVFYEQAPFNPEELKKLAEYARSEREIFTNNPRPCTLPDVDTPLKYQFNLLQNESNERAPQAEWSKFKKYIDTVYRGYLENVYGVRNAKDIRYVCRVLPVHYTTGQRTQPHYHHTCDHVLCLYLEVGENRTPTNERDRLRGDGELILCDPRAMASFPFWEKTRTYDPSPGFCLMHPSQVWHETNTFNSEGDRTLFAVTFKVISHNYTDLYEELHGV